MWFVYILRCRDNSLYTGITTDLDKRLARHNTGQGAKYTASRIPVKIVYYEEHPDKSSAIAREHSLKGLTKAKKEELVASSLVNKIDFLYYSKEKIS
ncbi:MAG: GIY-YIG nuclease family protein [Planctomycetes bacterium]|nr:GIY-YIG nuclease family protein [Planctomycetota bacterium]